MGSSSEEGLESLDSRSVDFLLHRTFVLPFRQGVKLMKMPVYRRLASYVMARDNCLRKAGDPVVGSWSDPGHWAEMADRHKEGAEFLVKNYLPRGSGVDGGTELDWDRSTPDKLVLHLPFHHMDEWGGYAGWTYHTVYVRPCLWGGFYFSSIGGPNHNGIKEYLADILHDALMTEVEL